MSNGVPGRRPMSSTLNGIDLGKRPPLQKRASLAVRSSLASRASLSTRLSLTSEPRRLSLFGVGSRQSAASTDTRPIGSKSFHQENIRALIKFLTLHNYDREISPKILFTPSRNDFVSISAFIFRKIYPNFEFDYNGKSWIDDFPLLFEILGYPQKISKRSLLSVGSPHTWPSLLAALVWLVDLAISLEAYEAAQDAKESADKDFFNYSLVAYSDFLKGGDKGDVLESTFGDQFNERNEATQQYIARTERELMEVRRDIVHLEKSRPALAEAQERRRNLSDDVAKLEKHIGEFQNFNQRLSKEHTELEEEISAGRSKLATCETEISSLRETLAKQKQSSVNISRIQSDQESLQQTLVNLQNESEQIESRRLQIETNTTKATDALNRSAQAYNQLTLRTGLQPLNDCKYGHGIDYELKVNIAGASAEDILGGTDMKRTVKPALSKLKQSFTKMVRKMAADKRRAQEALTMRTDTKNEKLEELKMLQARATKLDVSYREHREQKNAELRNRYTKVEDIELAIGKLKSAEDPHAVTEAEEAAKKAHDLLQEVTAKNQEEYDELVNLIQDTMNNLAHHKVHVSKTIGNMQDVISSYDVEDEYS